MLLLLPRLVQSCCTHLLLLLPLAGRVGRLNRVIVERSV